jgi:hypothetical protein
MRGIAHGMKPYNGKGPSVAVAKEFVKADEAKRKGKRTREQRADHKRSTDEWAQGKRKNT